jgi:hypothetical protein
MKDLWKDSSVQFPRLIAEINALGLTTSQLEDLAGSMDLEIDDVGELFERANVLWEIQKAKVSGSNIVYIPCPYCGYHPVHINQFGCSDDIIAAFICRQCHDSFDVDIHGKMITRDVD